MTSRTASHRGSPTGRRGVQRLLLEPRSRFTTLPPLILMSRGATWCPSLSCLPRDRFLRSISEALIMRIPGSTPPRLSTRLLLLPIAALTPPITTLSDPGRMPTLRRHTREIGFLRRSSTCLSPPLGRNLRPTTIRRPTRYRLHRVCGQDMVHPADACTVPSMSNTTCVQMLSVPCRLWSPRWVAPWSP